MLGFLRRRRHARLRAAPFPPAWSQLLARTCRFYSRLSDVDRAALDGAIQIFIAEKNFEGCDGLVMTDEIRLLIAAHACLLILHRADEIYPDLDSILVYPSGYSSPVLESMAGGAVQEKMMPRIGESSPRGVVVLAWNAIAAAVRGFSPGRNVAFHEFAHQLDFESGAADGMPELSGPRHYKQWARTFAEEFKRLRVDTVMGRDTVLDEYGTTNPAEFFAVVTETFFESPHALAARHAAMFDLLQQFYGQDPRLYVDPPEPTVG